jgi:uncharacterized membrane protein YeaQ/YmgE (transglycosylase-associated protein family)
MVLLIAVLRPGVVPVQAGPFPLAPASSNARRGLFCPHSLLPPDRLSSGHSGSWVDPEAIQQAQSVAAIGGKDMDWIIAIVMGGIIGWLASIVMKTNEQQGIFLNIIVGCVGSMLGRVLFKSFLGGGRMRDDAFDIPTLITAFLGAIVLLGIVNLVKRGRLR